MYESLIAKLRHLAALKQEVQFDAHEFHLALVFEFDEQA